MKALGYVGCIILLILSCIIANLLGYYRGYEKGIDESYFFFSNMYLDGAVHLGGMTTVRVQSWKNDEAYYSHRVGEEPAEECDKCKGSGFLWVQKYDKKENK